MDDEEMLRDLVAFIARSMVDHPESVDVQVNEQEGAFIIELRVAPSDMGKVIGRGGRIARAMRTVVRAAALKSGSRVLIEIVQ